MFRPLEIFIGLRYLRARRKNQFVSFISLMSLFGVAVGVAALIVVLSVMNGFENELRQRLLALTSHVSISGPNRRLDNWQELATRIASDKDVTGTAPYVEIQGMLGRGSRLKAVLVRGVLPASEGAVSQVGDNLIVGSLDDLVPGGNKIILGRLLAGQLGVAPGDSVTLMIPRGSEAGLVPRLRSLTVSGVFEVGMQEHDSLLALVHLRDASATLEMGDDVSGLRLRLENMFLAPSVSMRLTETLGEEIHGTDWTEENASYFRAVRIEKTMMTIVLLLVVAVAAFNIVATLIMVVTDKRSEIAILRTLGLAPGGVTRIFLVQGLVIGTVGTLLGAALGIPLAIHVEDVVPKIEALFGAQFFPADVYYIARLPSDVRMPDIVRVTGLAFLLCSLSTIYPAWRASKTEPAEALRYER
ncbi:MAG: lipoprotein-releasing ABC transporter permease subunit [Gammaproteobacteria bacterium]